MAQPKQNCWEHKRCGREPGGRNTTDLGVCPAASDTSFTGINSGLAGGRFCWAVAGTFCGGRIQGTFAEKRDSCIKCSFYLKVREAEGEINQRTKFLRFVSLDTGSSLLDKMTCIHMKKGQRFVTQGEIEERAFIIQRGTCIAIVEKDDSLYPVNHYGEGDIVGGLGILTGTPRLAHVEAEADMELWVLEKSQFDEISEKDPDLREFLTELVANRLDSRRPVAYRRIGKYFATDIIGRGGFSIVYGGVHEALNRPVAIKMMRHNLAMNPDFFSDFCNEAKTIASLDHENIVKVFDIEERFKTVFIIMELIEGTSLDMMINNLKAIPPPLASYYLYQICSGLDYAHSHGVIHRDINPTNIILQQNDRLKVIDFGLACRNGTEDFNMGGAFPYLAPELFDGEPGDPRTDIYALGVTAYEILTGEKPYQEEKAHNLMRMHRVQGIPDPAKLVPDMPDALRGFVRKACCRDPEKRYQSVTEAMQEIRPLVNPVDRRFSRSAITRQDTATLSLSYSGEQQEALGQLLSDFRSKVKDLGIDLRISGF